MHVELLEYHPLYITTSKADFKSREGDDVDSIWKDAVRLMDELTKERNWTSSQTNEGVEIWFRAKRDVRQTLIKHK
jgi:hypothetical protein